MKGFTVLYTEMLERDDDEKREVGKWHTIDGDLHAPNAWNRLYAKLEDAIPALGRVSKPRLFTCETGEEIITADNCYVARDIRLIREVDTQTTKAYLTANSDTLLNSDNAYVRAALAKYGVELEKLVNDPSHLVRCKVAENGYALDKLIDDDNWEVRAAVVRQGYRLDKLIKDPDPYMRVEVGLQGYGLDKLVHDPDPVVRIEIAKARRCLDVLVDDPDPSVRAAVARQGYGLYKLINDPDPEVSEIVKKELVEAEIVNSDPYEEIFNKYCAGFTADQRELARKCTANLREKTPELYECGLQSFVATLKS